MSNNFAPPRLTQPLLSVVSGGLWLMLYGYFFLKLTILNFTPLTKVLFFLLTVVAGYGLPFVWRSGILRRYCTPLRLGALSLITAYTAFALVGQRLFMQDSVTLTPASCLLYGLICLWLVPILLLVLYGLERCHVTAKKSTAIRSRRLWFTFTATAVAIWLVYLYGYSPGIMTYDSYWQWQQALGRVPLDNWHPVFHTLLLRLLTFIWPSPLLVSLVQIFFFAAIVSLGLVVLCRRGLSPWLAWIFLIVFAALPTSGMYAVTLWKDIPYSICLLWLTILLAELVTSPQDFWQSHGYMVQLILCLLGCTLLRHNGTIVLIFTEAVLLWRGMVSTKERRALWVGMAVLALVLVIKGPVYQSLDIIPTNSGTKYCAMTNDMIGVMLTADVPAQVQDYLTTLMPLEKHREIHTPYNFDAYLFAQGETYGVLEKMSQQSVPQALACYVATLVAHPLLTVQNRLSGLELLWNITMAPGSFDYVGGQVYESGVKFGITPAHNKVTATLNAVTQKLQQLELSSILIYRSGLYLALSLLLLLFLVVHRPQALILYVPMAANVLSLGLSMYHQSYRYVWFIFLIFWFLLLYALTAQQKPANKH